MRAAIFGVASMMKSRRARAIATSLVPSDTRTRCLVWLSLWTV